MNKYCITTATEIATYARADSEVAGLVQSSRDHDH